MDTFKLERNRLIIEFELFNDTQELIEHCLKLIESEHEEIEIYFSDRVFMVSSNHIGILMMTAAGAQIKGKRLTIYCTERLRDTICMLGGVKLDLAIRENLVPE
jgi:hypothetical protein